MRRDLERDGLGQPDDARLCRYIRDRVVLAFLAGDRRDVDDPTPAAFQHRREDGPAAMEHARQVDVDGALPDSERHLQGRDGLLADARVVDHDVDPAGPGQRGGHGRLDGRIVGHVAGRPASADEPVGSKRSARTSAGSRATSATTTRIPSRDEALAHRRAQRAGRAGHDGDPAVIRSSRRSSGCRLHLHFQRTRTPPDDFQCSPPHGREGAGMHIVDVRTVLLTGPSTNDPFLEAGHRRSAAFIEIPTDSGSSDWARPMRATSARDGPGDRRLLRADPPRPERRGHRRAWPRVPLRQLLGASGLGPAVTDRHRGGALGPQG